MPLCKRRLLGKELCGSFAWLKIKARCLLPCFFSFFLDIFSETSWQNKFFISWISVFELPISNGDFQTIWFSNYHGLEQSDLLTRISFTFFYFSFSKFLFLIFSFFLIHFLYLLFHLFFFLYFLFHVILYFLFFYSFSIFSFFSFFSVFFFFVLPF